MLEVIKRMKRININTFLSGYELLLDKDNCLTDKERKAVSLFVGAMNDNLEYFTIKEWAYVLATTFHETAHTFKPVVEAFWLSESWRSRNLRYYPYHGRGFVQITWKENYQKFSDLLNVDLVNNPDLTLDFDNSFYILTYGFKHGTFTGRKISDYVDFQEMRRCINGTDKAGLIASYSETFEEILSDSLD